MFQTTNSGDNASSASEKTALRTTNKEYNTSSGPEKTALQTTNNEYNTSSGPEKTALQTANKEYNTSSGPEKTVLQESLSQDVAISTENCEMGLPLAAPTVHRISTLPFLTDVSSTMHPVGSLGGPGEHTGQKA